MFQRSASLHPFHRSRRSLAAHLRLRVPADLSVRLARAGAAPAGGSDQQSGDRGSGVRHRPGAPARLCLRPLRAPLCRRRRLCGLPSGSPSCWTPRSGWASSSAFLSACSPPCFWQTSSGAIFFRDCSCSCTISCFFSGPCTPTQIQRSLFCPDRRGGAFSASRCAPVRSAFGRPDLDVSLPMCYHFPCILSCRTDDSPAAARLRISAP